MCIEVPTGLPRDRPGGEGAADRSVSMFPTVDDTQRAIQRLFPRFARCVVLPVTERCTTPFPEELDAVASAVPARRREFACGRACAHAALRALGEDDTPIPAASTRAPDWPHGIVGSISHTRELAAAVVCRGVDAQAVGLDLERADARLGEDARHLMLTPAEIAQTDAARGTDVRAAVLIFSAKESVHKVVAPLWGHHADPQDIEIRLDMAAYRFAATVRVRAGTDPAPGPAAAAARELRGSFTFVADHVVTALCLERHTEAMDLPAQ